MAIQPGLYEQLITQALKQELDKLDKGLKSITTRLDTEESHGILARYMEQYLAGILARVKGRDKLVKQIAVCNELIFSACNAIEKDQEGHGLLDLEGRRLLQVFDPALANSPRPETPLSVGALLTATSGDPSLVSQLKQEMLHADGVDMLVSFIKWSGIRIIKDELKALTRHGKLRVITTSYLGATDLKAIEFLLSLPNTEVRVSFNTRQTRLHAKAYIFHRKSAFGAAYVGSSNISNPALTDGLEWNVKLCQQESVHLWEKINATFETYLRSREFEPVCLESLPRLDRALNQERRGSVLTADQELSFFNIVPYTYQQEILDTLQAERALHHRCKNLVVAATGTGKTIIAAFDFKRSFDRPQQTRFLFVAHREEILVQSRGVFRNILRDNNFGELWVGSHRPDHLEQLFVSVQTLNARALWDEVPPDFFDYIVVDEFHRGAAPSYQRLLNYFTPKILLGLTATPERADGQNILAWFHDRICSEIRLPDAIDQKLLSPFQYFCISDSVDYSQIKWQRGGYDRTALEKLLVTGDDMRAQLIIEKAREILLDVSAARGICFCVSQAHAEYMADKLLAAGISAMALTAKTARDVRKAAVKRLQQRDVNFLCVVDLFNEGVDIPEIDTVLFLRPTESLTIFLQQLGRGLRLCEGKEHLTVLDFIGQAHQKFNFEIRFRSLLGKTSRRVEDEITASFPSLPSGCVIEMEKEAQRHVLNNIKKALTHANKNQMISRMATFEADTGLALTLNRFVDHHHLTLDDIYKKGSWSRLCVLAGLQEDFHDLDEAVLTKGLRRFCHHNDPGQLEPLLSVLKSHLERSFLEAMDPGMKQLLTLFCFSIWNSNPPETTLFCNLSRLKTNETLMDEICGLMAVLMERTDTLVHPIDLPFICPLSVHARYTRDEILAGLGCLTVENRVKLREGVKFLPELRADLLFITLNKTEKEYSPTTMYKDYALDEALFHWQSQSTTSDTSPTGQRYIHHEKQGHQILLFVREQKTFNALACPYYFLGPATYVRHTENRPMSIVWRLKYPMPARLTRTTRRLAVA
jgi:superfamily II DNA or RNA helicase/HKD family nuclease